MPFGGTHEWLIPRSSIRTALGISFMLLGLNPFMLAQQPNPSEAQVKAAYLLNFAKLATWPLNALPDSPSPFAICIRAADEEFVNVVKSVVAGKMIGTHSVTVKAANSEEDSKYCHILFFRTSGKKHAAISIENLPQTGLLLVGEDESFLQQGGMINLVRDHGSIRFEVNPDAMDHSEIRFSSKILALAKASYGVLPAIPPTRLIDGPRRLEHSPPPELPQLAELLKLTGTVKVEAFVNPDGSVREVKILGGHPVLAEALANAVKEWKYQPSAKETSEIVKFSFIPR